MLGKMIYRRKIDVLYVIVVLLVIFFHAESSLFSSGYIGVDILFVISGYLIISVFTKLVESGNTELMDMALYE